MNCQQLQECLYEYLDGSLSRSDTAAAQSHLTGCSACRAAVQRELQLAQSLSRQLEQSVESLSLDSNTRRAIAVTVKRKIAKTSERPPISLWSRLTLPFATATVILTAAILIGHHFIAGRDPHLETVPVAPQAGNGDVLVHISYSVPGYAFRKEGNLVTDALISDAHVEDGILVANKLKPAQPSVIYEN
jgi:hypothetical protein